MATYAMMPQRMPSEMLYDSGIITMVMNAGMASV